MSIAWSFFITYLISRTLYQISYEVFKYLKSSPDDLWKEYNRLLSLSAKDLRATFDDYQAVLDVRYARQVLGHMVLGQGGEWRDIPQSMALEKGYIDRPVIIGRDMQRALIVTGKQPDNHQT